MGFLDNAREKLKETAKKEVDTLLITGEIVEKFYMVKEDYCALTNKRLIFIDKSFTSNRKASTGIPFSKINSVSLKKGGAFSISKEVIVTVGSKDLDIDLWDANEALEIFKAISERIV